MKTSSELGFSLQVFTEILHIKGIIPMLKVKNVHNVRYAVRSTRILRDMHTSAACTDLRPIQMSDYE